MSLSIYQGLPHQASVAPSALTPGVAAPARGTAGVLSLDTPADELGSTSKGGGKRQVIAAAPGSASVSKVAHSGLLGIPKVVLPLIAEKLSLSDLARLARVCKDTCSEFPAGVDSKKLVTWKLLSQVAARMPVERLIQTRERGSFVSKLSKLSASGEVTRVNEAVKHFVASDPRRLSFIKEHLPHCYDFAIQSLSPSTDDIGTLKCRNSAEVDAFQKICHRIGKSLIKLDISFWKKSFKDLTFSIIAKCHNLQQLKVISTFSNSAVELIATLPKLQSLDLESDIDTEPAYGSAFPIAFAPFRNTLKSLRLYQINTKKGDDLVEVANQVGQGMFPELEYLHLRPAYQSNSKTLDRCIDRLTQNPSKLPKLRTLYLEGSDHNPAGEYNSIPSTASCAALCKLATNGGLRQLYIDNYNVDTWPKISPEQLAALAPALAQLDAFTLRHSNINKKAIMAMLEGTAALPHTFIIRDCRISTGAIRSLVNHPAAFKVKTLQIEHCDLRPEALRAIFEGSELYNLQTLNIHGDNKFSVEIVQAICIALERGCLPNLKHVVLPDFEHEDSFLVDDGTIHIGPVPRGKEEAFCVQKLYDYLHRRGIKVESCIW